MVTFKVRWQGGLRKASACGAVMLDVLKDLRPEEEMPGKTP